MSASTTTPPATTTDDAGTGTGTPTGVPGATRRERREGRLGPLGRGLVVAGLVVAAVMPWLVDSYALGQLGAAMYLVVAVASMNLLVGLNGQISVGHSAFVGSGAYIVTILVSDHGWQYGAAIVAAVVVTGLAGAVAALPALRLRGLYVALASLGVAMVFPTLVQVAYETTGGTAGKQVTVPFLPPAGTGLDIEQWTYLVLLVLTVLCLLLVRNLKHSRVGRAMRATRDHDRVATTFGVRVALVRITTFAISAGMAGVAGAMFAIQRQFVSPADFNLLFSIDLLVGMMIAGPTAVLGAIAGGGFLQFAPGWSERLGLEAVLTPLVYGAILIAFVLLFRGGVSGAVTGLLDRLDQRRTAPPGAPGRTDPTGPPGVPTDDPEPTAPTRPDPAAPAEEKP